MRRHRLLVLPVTGILLGAVAAPLALAQESGDRVVHRQSVLTEVDATGTAGTSRVFTQLTVPGSESVQLPGQATSGLRGLSGSGPDVDGDTVRFGAGTARAVADNTADLPVSIEIRYAIDGETVEPRDVVGHDGEVAVTYVVRNLTATPTELTLVDGDGEEITETVDVAVPMVGSLSMTLPSAFRDVVAPGGVVVGDGRGGTVVNWSLLLFSPLGSETQEVTWTAQATDAVVPSASLQVLPVTPDSFGSLASTEEAYAGAVGSTTQLTEGAREIDTNLRRLADGAGQLLAGLTQLRDGANELSTGLVTADEGAGELSDGLGRARTGAGTLSAGLTDLANGAGRLSAGVGSARAGATELGSGLGDLSAGATQLSDGLTTAQTGGNELATGLGQLSAGAGDLADGLTRAETGGNELVSGLGQLSSGAGDLAAGAEQVADGASQVDANMVALATGAAEVSDGATLVAGGIELLASELMSTTTGLPAVIGGLNRILQGLETQLIPLAEGLVTSLAGDPRQPTAMMLLGGLNNPGALAGNPTCQPTTEPANTCGVRQGLQVISGGLTVKADELDGRLGDPAVEGQTLRYGAAAVDSGAAAIADGAAQLRSQGTAPLAAGASQVSDGADQVAGGASAARTGGEALVDGLDRLAAGGSELAAGAAAAAAGGEELTDGLGRLAGGGLELSAGAARAAAGGSALADGLGQLDAGAGELTAGAGRAAAGAVDLNNGLVQLDDGGQRLASGLGDAAAGSQLLADGLGEATDGGDQIADGSEQLVEEGTTVLADSVSDATISSSMQLEQVRAVAARGVAGHGLPYPTVEGADASAVFQFDLAGVGAEEGPGVAGRFGIGLVALLLAFGAGLLTRRRVLVLSDMEVPASDRTTV